jgi:hypothetical protein
MAKEPRRTLGGDNRQALTLVTQGLGTVAVQIDPWLLEAPPIEYFADICHAQRIAGTPTLIFAQLGPNDLIVNAIAVAMPGKNFQAMITSFDPVIAKIDQVDLDAGHAIGPTPVTVSLTSENYRKFSAGLLRGGTSLEGAMIDFYRVGIPVTQQLQAGTIPQDLVNPAVRVLMAASTMVHLFDIIRAQGLA